MQRNKRILKDIAQYQHRTGYGANISQELVQVFRIKNLLLFAFKLLQKYEQVTKSACALIKKNVLLKQLHSAEEEVHRIEMQIEFWQSQNNAAERLIEDLRKKFTSLGKFSLPSGYSKANPLCLVSNKMEKDVFLDCDHIFYKKVSDAKLTEAQFVMLPQKQPLEYYKDLIYLQMHFNLLLVQGFNFALPLLTTRFSFLNRIIYWPHQPQYGFLDKSRRLQDKLWAIKAPIVICLDELINAIAEVEKWIIFSQNSYELFNTFMKGVCVRKKELFHELHTLKCQYRNFIFEHNRLVGAISKVDNTFFEKNPKWLNLDIESEILSFKSSEETAYSSVSAFSEHSNDNVQENISKNERNISTSNTKSDLMNFSILPTDYQSTQKKKSSESKAIRIVSFYSPTKKISVESMINIPAVGHSIPRSENVFSAPNENLFCRCVDALPSVEDTRWALLHPEPKNTNKNNHTLFAMFDHFNNSNYVNPRTPSIKAKLNQLIQNIKYAPKYEIIESEKINNYSLLRTISHNDQPAEERINMEDTAIDQAVVLNLISSPLSQDYLQPQSEDYYGILNSFLSSCGYQSVAGGNVEAHLVRSGNFVFDIFNAVDVEQDVLYKTYFIKSLNMDTMDHPVIHSEESNLMESLKLYSKYAF